MDNIFSEQESFLNHLVDDQVLVNVFLVNGIRLIGKIHSYDQKIVLLSCATGLQVIFKHSVSTIQVGEHTHPRNTSVPTQRTSRAGYGADARRRPDA